MNRVSLSLLISFGVVPDATRAWNPEIAPQAIVTNRKGKSFPGMIGPPPSMYCRERRHLEVRVHHDHPDDQCRDGADLHVGTEVVAGDQQQPDRKDRGDEPVERQGDHDPFAATA